MHDDEDFELYKAITDDIDRFKQHVLDAHKIKGYALILHFEEEDGTLGHVVNFKAENYLEMIGLLCCSLFNQDDVEELD